MKKNETDRGEIVIYRTPQKDIDLKVQLKKGTVWLNAHQMAQIFGVNRPAIVKHVNNIYKTHELHKNPTSSILEQVAADGKIRKMNFYNLDMIISVGYRVNSKRATQFRIWATNILKQHILRGYTLNETRLLEAKEKFEELQKTIDFIRNKAGKKELAGHEKEILSLLSNYAKTLRIIEEHDKGNLKIPKGKKAKYVLSTEDTYRIIEEVKHGLIRKKQASKLFGRVASKNVESIVRSLYQTFGRKELYPTLESKAAHLLYLTIKDHPFVDGNKRIGAFLFVYFLDKNRALHKKTGEPKINDNALTALAFLIAASDPKEKDILIKIILNLLAD